VGNSDHGLVEADGSVVGTIAANKRFRAAALLGRGSSAELERMKRAAIVVGYVMIVVGMPFVLDACLSSMHRCTWHRGVDCGHYSCVLAFVAWASGPAVLALSIVAFLTILLPLVVLVHRFSDLRYLGRDNYGRMARISRSWIAVRPGMGCFVAGRLCCGSLGVPTAL
jgi:hypothetical protein